MAPGADVTGDALRSGRPAGTTVTRSASARPLLGDVACLERLTTLQLAPFSVDAVTTLLDGTELQPKQVHQLTGGNPFFLIETLRYLYESDARAAQRFRYGLLAFDIFTILFIVFTSFSPGNATLEWLDIVFGVGVWVLCWHLGIRTRCRLTLPTSIRK